MFIFKTICLLSLTCDPLPYYLRRRRRLCFRCGLFVCLFVCLSVCLFVCLFVCLSAGLLANLWTDFDEIFWRGRAWLKDQVIQFWWRSGSCFGSGSPKSEIRILRIGGGLFSVSAFLLWMLLGTLPLDSCRGLLCCATFFPSSVLPYTHHKHAYLTYSVTDSPSTGVMWHLQRLTGDVLRHGYGGHFSQSQVCSHWLPNKIFVECDWTSRMKILWF